MIKCPDVKVISRAGDEPTPIAASVTTDTHPTTAASSYPTRSAGSGNPPANRSVTGQTRNSPSLRRSRWRFVVPSHSELVSEASDESGGSDEVTPDHHGK